jgi:hypothetical protein
VNVTELPLYLGRIEAALQSRAAAAAADAMAAEFHTQLTEVTLALTSHGKGEKTLSTPGTPPALVSGTLRNSAQAVPAVSAGPRAVSLVRVTAVYARIQEKGGTVTAGRAPYLRFQYPSGRWHSVKSVKLPARPYMRPTRDLLIATGRLQARAAQAVAGVAREAAG